MLAGYGTIALEILDQVPNVEAIIVPVGTGGLAAAITAVIKHTKPNCLVYVSIVTLAKLLIRQPVWKRPCSNNRD